ncbi:DNA-binding protein [Desulfovibrio mangrovi]|uniref:PPC domain-containing DNA-binding protein n=1 Tax=Desulfovibrio mangrovi TaxID=2976983 RepID=UPI002247BACD|nr:PPC domain-containing DNA-binding protein [Desulfovibrio mangrovi]UZP68532.1 DNA-binding protein [Desulfovibrio mangrovi]
MIPIAIRLHPGQDILAELESIAELQEYEAACILTCAGSLTKACLRLANCNEATELHGHFEIVSLTGTLSRHGSHLHIAIADGQGKTIGAHLLAGSAVYTTAEIVIGILPDMRFLRTMDTQTGFPELDIQTIVKE